MGTAGWKKAAILVVVGLYLLRRVEEAERRRDPVPRVYPQPNSTDDGPIGPGSMRDR